jgi:hypothetical protein
MEKKLISLSTQIYLLSLPYNFTYNFRRASGFLFLFYLRTPKFITLGLEYFVPWCAPECHQEQELPVSQSIVLSRDTSTFL